jgi:hypothetical protein
MTIPKPFFVKFRFPILYGIFFGIALLICFPLGAYLILADIDTIAGTVIIGISFFAFYLFYETTKTIQVDEQGIALHSLLGEIKRFSWHEISGMKSTGFLSPGIKLYNLDGESLEISQMFNHYDVILEVIRREGKDFIQETPAKKIQPIVSSHAKDRSFDFIFKVKWYRWTAVPLFLMISVSLFLLSLQNGELLYITLFSIFLLAGFPAFTIGFFKSPVLIATKGENLFIQFPSSRLRSPIQVRVDQVENICFHHHQVYTERGAAHPTTNLTIYLLGGVKITASSFDQSNEEMYFKLCGWLERYIEIFDQQ